MKKFLFLAIAAAAMTSCSQDEVLEVAQKQAISFGNAFVGNSTRAIDPSYSTTDKGVALTKFNVYGTVNDNNIFNNVLIEKGNAVYGAEWTQKGGTTQYWIPGANYKFVGIVDGNKENVTQTTINSSTGMPTSISYAADGATDLLCATVTRTAVANENALVAFEFTHLLSKVNFTVTNGSKDATGYSFVVKNINFAGNVSGSYDVEKAQWNSTFATGTISVGNVRTVEENSVKDIVVGTTDQKVELGTEVLFLPGQYAITFTVDIVYNGNVITTTDYPATGTYSYTLAQNTAYNFNVTVSIGQQIKFTATKIKEWVNGNTDKSDDTLTENDIVPIV